MFVLVPVQSVAMTTRKEPMLLLGESFSISSTELRFVEEEEEEEEETRAVSTWHPRKGSACCKRDRCPSHEPIISTFGSASMRAAISVGARKVFIILI